MLPNFIIGGTSAGGTSFLTSILLQHGDIYLPKKMRPEPHFFYYTHKYTNGIEWYKQEWFSEYAGQKAVGERSSSYLYHENSALRIKQHLPDVKLIFVLRHPTERAWANYRYTVLSGLEELDFEEALRLESKRIEEEVGIWQEVQPHDYTGRSYYGKQIEFYLKLFPFSQILLISSEKLNNDTQNQINRITDFLEIERLENFDIPVTFTSLSVNEPRVQAQCRMDLGGDKFNLIIESIRRKEDDLSIYAANEEELRVIEKLKNNLSDKKQPLLASTRDKLNNLFADDQKKLFSLVKNHVDFEPWL
ncbi:sulfotransferase [Legionella taurinensis]|uniref:Sulfotransferase n=1 Tax=Legionella taurinensis TaxID=70611 RepID=A0A3A5L4U5_9GAMM|nr:sulfotransferase domain-containing protein [Legionella taurinensis]MDX1838010.1 sulfotransferase domain-containing protein [Legionella taurinensis]PUT39402.1 sulfotransferase [Legionella taurinensis]PUT41711.1 sulfotransferase [Legionella taurinensis]PUT44545.1 sulfotransferase [Legionella taurinensis]PUT46789.1 sulfotransferase [Legionella taurinensis]